MPKSLYEILGLPVGSGEIAIRRAYRRLAFKHHPDTGDGNSEALQKIIEAYDLLSNPEKKERYDAVIQILEEQKKTEEKVETSWKKPGVWNIPNPSPLYGKWVSGSSYSYSVSPRVTITIRVDDVMSKGLNGLLPGQKVWVTGIPIASSGSIGYSYTAHPHMHLSPPIGGTGVAGVLTRASYGAAVGLPAYGDFEVEIQ